MEAWMNRTGGTGVTNYITVGTAFTSQYLMRWYSSAGANANKIGFLLRTSTGAPVERCTTSTISTGWHHIVCVYDGTLPSNNITVYIDGVPETLSATVTSNLYTPSTTSTALVNTFSRDTAGSDTLTSEIAIYNYPLSSAQVSDHYNVGKTAYYKTYPGNTVVADNPVGYWRMGETS